MSATLQEALTRFETARNRPALLYCCSSEQGVSLKGIDESDVPILYSCLHLQGRVAAIDVILDTSGGVIGAAYRIAKLLHNFADMVTIWVPFRARSAGTLLCLGASDLVFGPIAELGPLDPNISMAEQSQVGPRLISSADIRAFRSMAEEWFGLQQEEHRIQVFSLLSQKFFPTSLSAFYRADRYMRTVAQELLAYQLPNSTPQERAAIVDRFVDGFDSHSHSIDFQEAHGLGLNIRMADGQEVQFVWPIWQAWNQHVKTPHIDYMALTGEVYSGGIIASRAFWAEYLTQFAPNPVHSPAPAANTAPQIRSRGWVIAERPPS